MKSSFIVPDKRQSFKLSLTINKPNKLNGFCPLVLFANYNRLKTENLLNEHVGSEAFREKLENRLGGFLKVEGSALDNLLLGNRVGGTPLPFSRMRATLTNGGGGGCNYYSQPIPVNNENEGKYVVVSMVDLMGEDTRLNVTQDNLNELEKLVYMGFTKVLFQNKRSSLSLLVCDEKSDQNYMTFHSKVKCPRDLVNRAINMQGKLFVYKTEIATHNAPVHQCRRILTRKESIYYPDMTYVNRQYRTESAVPVEDCKEWLATKKISPSGTATFTCRRDPTNRGSLERASFKEEASVGTEKVYVSNHTVEYPQWCCGLKHQSGYNCEVRTGWIQTQNPYKRLTSSFGDIFSFDEAMTSYTSDTGTLVWDKFESDVYCRYKLWQILENVTRVYYPSYHDPEEDILHYSSKSTKTTFSTDLQQYADVKKLLEADSSLICEGSDTEKVSNETLEYFFSGPNTIVGFVPYNLEERRGQRQNHTPLLMACTQMGNINDHQLS